MQPPVKQDCQGVCKVITALTGRRVQAPLLPLTARLQILGALAAVNHAFESVSFDPNPKPSDSSLTYVPYRNPSSGAESAPVPLFKAHEVSNLQCCCAGIERSTILLT